MAGDTINTIVDKEAYKQVALLTKDLKKARLEMVEFLKVGAGVSGLNFSQIKLPSDLNATLKQNKEYTEQLNAAISEQSRLEKALVSQIAKKDAVTESTSKALIKNRLETQILTQKEKELLKTTTKLAGEYARQSAILNKLRKDYKNLALEEGESSNQAKKLLKNITQLDAKLKRVDASVGQHQRNVGNYGKSWGNVGKIMLSVASAFGIYSALEVGKQIFSQIKEIDGLNKSLKQVVETSEAYTQAQSFIKELAEETGVEINTLQKSYTKFFASAKTTNLTLAETQDIFRQTAKAGAVLNLSTEEVNGSMKALEQILSKGKVQAEEIRGQLGERLPGAFQILAKSMGLTTEQLSKQLELGNVISDEVLPGFARELEKTFGLDQVNKVDTLNAAQGRLSNSWNEFIRTLDGSQGRIAKVFSFLINQISNSVKGFRLLITTAEQLNAEGLDKTKLEAYTAAIKEIGDESKRTGKNIKDVAFESAEAADARLDDLLKEKKALVERNKEIEKQRGKEGGVIFSAGNTEWKKNKKEIDEYNKSIAIYSGMLKAAEELEEDVIKKKREDDKVTGELAQREEVLAIGVENTGKVAFASKTYFEGLTNELKNQQKNLARTSEEWQFFEDQIKKAEDAIKTIEGTFIDSQLEVTPEEKIEIDDFLNTQGITKGMENLSFILGESSDELMKEFKSSYDWDYQEFLKWSNKKIEQSDVEAQKKKEDLLMWMDISSAAINGVGNLFSVISDRKISKIDDEIKENEMLYDSILEEAEARGASDEQITEIEKQKEERRLKLEEKKRIEKQKQARAEKAFAAFQIIINTAASIIEALPNVPLSIAVGALGAIELAAVLATPVPKYKDGRKGGKEELAITGDGGVSEFITDKSGRLKAITPNKPTYTHLAEGDTVHKNLDAFADSLGYDDLVKASILTSISNQNDKLSSNELESVLDGHLRATRTEVRKGIEDGIKTLKFPKQQAMPDFNAAMRVMLRKNV